MFFMCIIGGPWNPRFLSSAYHQKSISSWSLNFIFCSFEVLMSTSKLQNMSFKLQLQICCKAKRHRNVTNLCFL